LDVEKRRQVLLEGGLILLITFFAGTLIAYSIMPKETRLFLSVISGAVGVVLFSLFVVPRLAKSIEERLWAYSAFSMIPPILLFFPLLFQFYINEAHATEPEFVSLFFATAIPLSCGFGFLIYEVLSKHYGGFGGFKIKRIGGRIVLVLFVVAWYVLIYNIAYAFLASTVVGRYILMIDLLVASVILTIAVAKVQRVKVFLGRLEKGNW